MSGYTAVGVSMDGFDVARLLWTTATGDALIGNLLPDNQTSSVLTSLAAAHTSGTGLTCGYTGDGLRAWKQTDAGARTYFLYDGSDPVCEMDGGGNVTAVNTFGTTGLLSRHTTSPSASTFYTFDERGSVAQRTPKNRKAPRNLNRLRGASRCLSARAASSERPASGAAA